MFIKRITQVTGLVVAMLFGAAAYADCGPSGASIRILASDFPAIHAVAGTAEEMCGSSASEFTRNHTTEARAIMNEAQTPNPAVYTSVIVANSTLVQLMNDGLVRPLNDLVDKYGGDLKPSQLITIDGNVMAIGFMANSQHLFSRTDILEQAGVSGVPETYEDVLSAAAKIRAAGIMEHPIVMNMKTGWNLGEVFNMIYMAHDGDLFKSGTAEPNVNNHKGVATLNLMKGLSEYLHPDHLTQASDQTQGLWEAGKAALGIMWGSRGGVILDDEGSSAAVTSNTVLSSAPSVTASSVSTPASTLWWDGITIATNIPDKDAEATFAALVGAMTPDMVAANNDDAIWLIDGYKPGPAAAGVSETASNGANAYPMYPYMGAMHNALGAEIGDFLKGVETAEQTLADIEAAYVLSAKEQGYL